MTRCIHGLAAAACGICNGDAQRRRDLDRARGASWSETELDTVARFIRGNAERFDWHRNLWRAGPEYAELASALPGRTDGAIAFMVIAFIDGPAALGSRRDDPWTEAAVSSRVRDAWDRTAGG